MINGLKKTIYWMAFNMSSAENGQPTKMISSSTTTQGTAMTLRPIPLSTPSGVYVLTSSYSKPG